MRAKDEGAHNVFIYDTRDDTLDVSLLIVEDNIFEVNATTTDRRAL